MITANWLWEIPVGKGRRWGKDMSAGNERVLGGWQFSGIVRWTSGLPFSIISGSGWGTDWLEKSYMVQTGPIHTHHGHNVFANPGEAEQNMRMPYPGEAGNRNNFRGDGYFEIDTSLAKDIRLTERSKLRLAWDVFNVTNSVRFDVNPILSLQNVAGNGSLGETSQMLNKPRVMQFSMRYSY
jgi:hypothetical protein